MNILEFGTNLPPPRLLIFLIRSCLDILIVDPPFVILMPCVLRKLINIKCSVITAFALFSAKVLRNQCFVYIPSVSI